MRKQIRFTGLGLLGASMMMAPQAIYAEQAATSFRIGGIVRTICKVEFSNPAPIVTAGVVEFGNMTELCNQRDGYRLIMHHPEGMEGARFEIGGREVELSSGTETVLVDSSHPSFRVSEARLELAGGDSDPTALYFRVEPRGSIY